MPQANKRKADLVGEKELLPGKRAKLSSPRNGEPRRPIAGRQVRGEERGESSSRQHEMLVEEPEDPARDKFVTSAQEDLMQMIEERASDKAIENQMKIIKMFRVRLLSNNGSQISCGANHMQPAKENIQEKAPAIEPSRELNRGSRPIKVHPEPRNALFNSSGHNSTPSKNLPPFGRATHAVSKGRAPASAFSTPSNSSDFTRETRSLKKAREAAASESASASTTPSGPTPSEDLTPTSRITRSVTKGKEAANTTATAAAGSATSTTVGIANPSSPPTPSPALAPVRRRKSRFSNAKATRPSKAVTELLKSARPAAAPTTLPAAQRTNKTLSATEVAQLSTVHSSFDQKATSRFNRHERKINKTVAMASYAKSVMKERALKERVRSPTQSPPDARAAAATTVSSGGGGGGMRLDAASLRAVSEAASAAAASKTATTTGRGGVELQPAMRSEQQQQEQEQQQPTVRRGLPGQVFNQTLNRWIFVEESDSDS